MQSGIATVTKDATMEFDIPETVMLSQTFSPVRETILIQHFNYTFVI